MKKIMLSTDEIEVINQYLKGEIEVWNATDEQQKLLGGVIDKADALLEELDAYDELQKVPNADLLIWYFEKYKAQTDVTE